MGSNLIRFYGTRNASRGSSVVRLTGFLPLEDKPIMLVLTLGGHLSNSSALHIGQLSSGQRQTLRFVSIDVVNDKHPEPVRAYTANGTGIQVSGVTIDITGFNYLSAPGAHSDTQYIATFENQGLPQTSQTSLPEKPLSCLTFTQNDVVFIFPNEALEDPYLWGNIETLSNVSPYWKTMFEAGYSESEAVLTDGTAWNTGWKSDLKEILANNRAGGAVPLPDVPDSDEEGPLARIASRVHAQKDGKKPYLDPSRSVHQTSIHYVIVKGTPLRTYQAVLTWLLNGHVNFAYLTSDIPPLSVYDSVKLRDKTLSSPKSIYRLTHLLEIDALRKLALANYISQLSARNALTELFAEASYRYPELQEAAMTAAVNNWVAIKAAGGPAAIKRAIEGGRADTDQLSRVAMDLLGRV